MAFKTITIKETVYRLINQAKKKDESFSDLFERTFHEEKPDIMKYFGIWKTTDAAYKRKLKQMRKYREEFDRDFMKRQKYLDQYRRKK